MPRRASTNYDDDIVERTLTDYLALGLLVVASLAIAGAIALQVAEIYIYRGPDRSSTTIFDMAKDHAHTLETSVKRSWTDFDTAAKDGMAAAPKEGKIQRTAGGGFEVLNPDAFKGIDVNQVIQELIEEYGYGKDVYRPTLKSKGIEVEGGSVIDTLQPDTQVEGVIDLDTEPKDTSTQEKLDEGFLDDLPKDENTGTTEDDAGLDESLPEGLK